MSWSIPTHRLPSRVSAAVLILILTGLSACSDVGPRKSGLAASPRAAAVSTGGTVVFREKDGGFFGILADNGKQYEPVNLDPSYHTEGLRVRLSGVIDSTVLGHHQWGNPLEIERVSVVK